MRYVGQKVRCVNDRFPAAVFEWGSSLPRKGEVYTIRAIRSVPCAFSGAISPAFLLEELSNPYDRLHFNPHRFVPANPTEKSLEQALRQTMQLHQQKRQKVASKVQRVFRILENVDANEF